MILRPLQVESAKAAMPVQIHPMTIADYDQVLALWQQCEGVGLGAADSRDNIAAYLIRNPNMSFIARSDESLIGAVLCGHDGRRGYLHHLAVHPTARRQGIARQLVDRCLRELQRAGIAKCHLFVFSPVT